MDEKTNQKREDQHFTESWYRDQVKLGFPEKVIVKSFNKSKEEKEKFYSEWRKSQRRKQFKIVAAIVIASIAVAYSLVMLGVRL